MSASTDQPTPTPPQTFEQKVDAVCRHISNIGIATIPVLDAQRIAREADAALRAAQQARETAEAEVEHWVGKYNDLEKWRAQTSRLHLESEAKVLALTADLTRAREEIKLYEHVVRRHSEAASIFQPGGALHAEADLPLGSSAVVEGIAWLHRERTAAQAQAEALRAALAKVEWIHQYPSEWDFCSCCQQYRHHGHQKDCELAAALAPQPSAPAKEEA